jgi:hypothetical protein
VSALPEVSPHDAILVDPLSIDEIAAGMEKLLLSTDDDEAITARIASVARFDWDAAAAAHVDLFGRVFT